MRSGESLAFETFWQRYQRLLWNHLQRKMRGLDQGLRSKIEAEDLLQVTMERGFQGLDELVYKSRPALVSWLFTILDRVLLNQIEHWKAGRRDYRMDGSRPAAEAQSRSPEAMLAESTRGPLTRLAYSEQMQRLGEVIADLDETLYMLIQLRFFAGSTWKEVADEIGKPSADAARMTFTNFLPELRDRCREAGCDSEFLT